MEANEAQVRWETAEQEAHASALLLAARLPHQAARVDLFPGHVKLAPMKFPLLTALLTLCAASIAGQAPVSTAAQTYTNALGFSYTLPAGWEVLDAQPALPAVRQQVDKEATSDAEKKGVECVQVALMARHGDPPSAIVVVALPYDCFGQTMKDSDLPAFAMGTAEGLKKSWNIVDPQYGAYTLGSHNMWIERAGGNPMGQPESKRSVEVVCGMLKNGVVCWMAFAVDDAALRVFEQAPVVLDGDAPAALVPANAFQTKPS